MEFLEVTNDTSDKEIIEFLNKDFDINKFNISLQNLYHSFYDELSQNGIYQWIQIIMSRIILKSYY